MKKRSTARSKVPPRRRCYGDGDPLMEKYHDQEWGTVNRDDRHLFEHLCLEAFQAGLSWRCVLHKRENFRRAFAGFDPARVARFGAKEEARLLSDPGIIRNRQKIAAVIKNARAFLKVQKEFGCFADFLWPFAPPPRKHPNPAGHFPVTCQEAENLSRELKRRGFSFVGPTGMYAFMQSVGLVNDHAAGCFRAPAPKK